MFIDNDLVLAEKQAVTGGTLSVPFVSTNTIDMKKAGDAVGQELNFDVVVTTDIAGTTASRAQAVLQTSADNSAWEDVVLSPAIAVNGMKAGSKLFKVRVLQGTKQYLRSEVIITGATLSAGRITAFFAKEL